MFTWICPQCGREVPPSYTECPDCAARAAGKMAPAAGQGAEAPPPAAPPRAAGHVAPSAPQTPAAPSAARGPGLPTWVLSIVFALAFVGLGACIIWGVNYFRERGRSGPPLAAEVAPNKPGTPSVLQRYVEVTGVRLLQNAKKATEARFVVVNHSNAEITGLEGTVTIWGRTRKSDEEAEGTFKFKVPSIAPYSAVESTAPVNTKLKVYELPDWQNVTAEVQITAPVM